MKHRGWGKPPALTPSEPVDVRSERLGAALLAERHGIPVVDLWTITPEPEATALIDEHTARALTALPLAVREGAVLVVLADPAAGARVEEALGRPVRIVLAAPSDIVRAIGNTFRALAAIDEPLKQFQARGTTSPADEVVVNEDAPVVQVVQLVITQGLRDRASDIHIEPHDDRVRVRFRVDGVLRDQLDLPGAIGPAVASRIKVLADLNIIERRRSQDGQIRMRVEGRAVDIRVSTAAVVGGEKVVLRLLDKSRPLFRLEQLGMPPELAGKYAGLLRTPYGMVICAGPTGSGKTTTLYGSLGEIDSPERNIMTIEDPVEYSYGSINQIQINEAAGITFATGLRSILRQDPDVILVGEIRDVETARMAVQSALTGHLVLSSVHATDTATALHRLLDMGIETFLVASSVNAVISQRLIRTICENCREYYEPPAAERAFLRGAGAEVPAVGLIRGAGCNFCARTGYLERTGVYELMPVSDAIRELVVDRAPLAEIRKAACYEGMRTLEQEGARLAQAGVTTVAEVLRSIYTVGMR
ncbi:type II/IV secretion system protein [Kribbella turkmenica]|uniref:Type II/IV secretion system protein n=1 Tax=Kribbella turkmenica TaxID=2530375 RepID=A0A4R4WRL8_9ACTN|nr:GspE/PulE family protein [Kribbella turkmenica]TDD18390.1 type II/IV secretion system protein [Kribbella turkmenica]